MLTNGGRDIRANGSNVASEKTAIVLTAGGSRGALEVGAVLALLEHGTQPTMLVGASVGAFNAAAIAADPTVEGVRRLARSWVEVAKRGLAPSRPRMAWRMLTRRDGLVSSDKLKRLIEEHIPEGARHFYDMEDVELYIVAANLNTTHMHVFGLDESDSVVDAVMASMALPPYFAPWSYRGQQYIDGMILIDVPVRVALNQGADEVWTVDLSRSSRARHNIRGPLNVLKRSIRIMGEQHTPSELEYSGEAEHEQHRIRHIVVEEFTDVPFWDFSRTSEMIDEGHRIAANSLRDRH